MIDRISILAPWSEIHADKAVSLEEYYLKERLGQGGEMPESLLFGACFEAAGWLASASSDFKYTALPEEVSDFSVGRTMLPGEICRIVLNVKNMTRQGMLLACAGRTGNERIISGEFSVTIVPMDELYVPSERKSLWRELFRAEGEI